jgi:hypothetical protein
MRANAAQFPTDLYACAAEHCFTFAMLVTRLARTSHVGDAVPLIKISSTSFVDSNHPKPEPFGQRMVGRPGSFRIQ